MAYIPFRSVCMRLGAALCAASLASAPALAETEASSSADKLIALPANWAVRLPKDDKVAFHGAFNLDNAGVQTGPILYPAFGIGGFVAAVVAHGLATEAVKQAQRTKIQDEADKILVPYDPIITHLSHRALLQASLQKMPSSEGKHMVENDAVPAAEWLVDAQPAFAMTQDQTALVLENVFTVYRPGALEKPAYQTVVRVVSASHQESDLAAFWTANEGEQLKAETSNLEAESLSIVASVVGSDLGKDSPFKTIRYHAGQREMMERAQIVALHCDREVIRTLRGNLISVPIKPDPADASCTATQ